MKFGVGFSVLPPLAIATAVVWYVLYRPDVLGLLLLDSMS